MGASQSIDDSDNLPSPEGLSHTLAERFATRCFTPLELTHFKDNFYSRALDEGGLRYWNERILSDFLGIPDGVEPCGATTVFESPLDPGPVIFRMVSYLGAFPFQVTLAPSVLTFEAMVKVVVLLTERYGKVLKRGPKDRIKLLFGSLADVGRKIAPFEHKKERELGVYNSTSPKAVENASPRVSGFAVDEPANDGDEEDDDDLALAALESLDAIEVFNQDSRIDRVTYESRISVNTLRRLLMLLLVIAPLEPLEPVSKYTSTLDGNSMESVRSEADKILAAFSPGEIANGIHYKSFARIVSLALPHVFDPLTPLFEHLLFSNNLDLSRKDFRLEPSHSHVPPTEKILGLPSPARSPFLLPGSFESAILNPSVLSHLSFFLFVSSGQNLFRTGTRLYPVFSTAAHGESLTTFSHNVLTWQSPTLLLVHGALANSCESKEGLITLGAYLPHPWKPSSSIDASTNNDDCSKVPCLFQLSPAHSVLRGNLSPISRKPTNPAIVFSTDTGIAIGCKVAPVTTVTRTGFGPGVTLPSSHGKTYQRPPVPTGGGSLLIDSALETAQLHVSYTSTAGLVLPPVPSNLATTTQIDIYNLEIWGLVNDQPCHPSHLGGLKSPPSQVHDAIALQRAQWESEARDAERRRTINLRLGGGSDADMQTARALLDMAGITGDSG